MIFSWPILRTCGTSCSNMIEPTCKHHPDRLASAYYGKRYEYGLCMECVVATLRRYAREPLDEHGARMKLADRRAMDERAEN